MKRPSLIQGILVAFAITLAGLSLAMLIPTYLKWSPIAFNALVSAVTFAYVLYLLSRCVVRTGRITLGALAALSLFAANALGFSWPLTLALALGLIWLTRSLYAYSSVLGSLADGMLCVLSLGWAAAALSLTGSLLWAVWCFFLAQALFTLIPPRGIGSGAGSGAGGNPVIGELDPFARAHAAAEAAIRQLAARD